MQKVLDAGCGLGRFIYNYSRRNPGQYFGVDLDPENISQAQKNYPDINFQAMSVEKLEFPDSYFDVIISRDVLEHVDNLPATLVEMTRVLKPQGKLIVKLPAKKSEHWLTSLRPTYFSEIHHVRIFEDNGLTEMVMPLGYKLLKSEPQGFLDHLFLYFLFKTTKVSETQIALGSWRNHWWGWIIGPIHAFLKPELVFDTWLKFIPVWIITLPIGYVINFFGNKIMPKSWYYEFIKN